MRRTFTAALGLGLCLCTAPAWAQSPGAGNPCGVGHAANGDGGGSFIHLGFGATVATEAGDCDKDRTATHLFLMWKESHDERLYKAAIQVMCSEDGMRTMAPALCANALPPSIAVIPPQIDPARVAAAQQAVPPTTIAAQPPPPIVAVTSIQATARPIELHAGVSPWAKCPVGVPLSECSP